MSLLSKIGFVTLLFLFSCGGGGGGSIPVELPEEPLPVQLSVQDQAMVDLGGEYELGHHEVHMYFILFPDKANGRLILFAPTFLETYSDISPESYLQYYVGRLRMYGFMIAGIDIGESWGSEKGRAVYSAFISSLQVRFGLKPRVSFLCVSRGCLMATAWACDRPEMVDRMAMIYPLLDFRDYGGLELIAKEWGCTKEELEASLSWTNPVNRIGGLAAYGIPLLILAGGEDNVVPLISNGWVAAETYNRLGGNVQVLLWDELGHTIEPEYFENDAVTLFFSDG